MATPTTFLNIPARNIRVSTEGEVYCIHNRLAVKFLSTTAGNLFRFFWTCDGCNWQNQHPRRRGWIWQDEILSALQNQAGRLQFHHRGELKFIPDSGSRWQILGAITKVKWHGPKSSRAPSFIHHKGPSCRPYDALIYILLLSTQSLNEILNPRKDMERGGTLADKLIGLH
ncbi:hypothetical protein AB1N83_010270 [Pleurotus pulmonarius]